MTSKHSAFLATMILGGAVIGLGDLTAPAGWTQTIAKKQTAKQVEAERLFTLKVLPLLKGRCLGCHGEKPRRLRGGFDVRTRAALLRGGNSEKPAVIPGTPQASPLYHAVLWKDLKMPPKENDRLNKQEIKWIRAWIVAGAPWPDAKKQAKYRAKEWSQPANKDGVLVTTSGGLSKEWTYRRYLPKDLWAFQPLQKVAPPMKGHPIDAFIHQKLNQLKLKPAPRADKLTLIRRATYDLTGLPPTPKEIEAFLKDTSPNAWEKVIDRLLASPHYGEQWGRHWLDVTRYGDTSGYSNDWERSNAWRYRDYVIRSINSDKPFNRFILEQIAGDELDPDNPEMLIAVGFLRMGPWEHTPMSQVTVSRQLWLDDVTNSVGQVFLSTPLRCCKCHDHKFDPFPIRDYYRFQAAFATTQLAERPVPFLPCENRKGFEQGRARVHKLLKWAQDDANRVKAKETRAAMEWYKQRGLPYISRYSKEAKKLPEGKKHPRFIGLDHTDQGFQKVRLQDARIWTRRLERYQPRAQSVYNGGNLYQRSQILRMPKKQWEKQKSKVVPTTFILAGGSVQSPKQKVTPGVLSAIPVSLSKDHKPSFPTSVPTTMENRRLALAKWIAHPENPLTTRSIVNRIWQYHFGKGIAENANNFGKTGSYPTHPELLDWLTRHFIEHGWSMKKLHRLIMTSETYQQSSRHPDLASVRKVDPTNKFLAHFWPRRLSAEELRDSMLIVSGELNKEMGGLPIKPEINLDVALQPRMLQFSLAPAYQPSRTPNERNRRSIYAYRCRGQANPFFKVFNQPNPDDSCERRETSTVTPQVFTMMNSDNAVNRAIALALRVQKEAKALSGQLDQAYKLAFGRFPTRNEKELLVHHVRKMVAYHRKHPPKKIAFPTKVTRSLVEELSGKSFDYIERLDMYENYVPHKNPWDVSAETRALADVCLLLLNANEFVYVY
ncbi:MAG: PSD1 and planctomycete cytochrome C domain-containing protein [Gemmataceae bacterium]